MNRIPALLHKRPSAQAFCSWWGVEDSGSPPHTPSNPSSLRTGANRRNVSRCQEAVKCWRGGQQAFTHVALLSQLHLAFSPFLLHLPLAFFFFLTLSSAFLTPPCPLLLFLIILLSTRRSTIMNVPVAPVVLFLHRDGSSCVVGHHYKIRPVSWGAFFPPIKYVICYSTCII